MFNWLRRLFGNYQCGLCKEPFKSKNPDYIVMEYSSGDKEEFDICTVCAAQLELIKRRNSEAHFRVEYD